MKAEMLHNVLNNSKDIKMQGNNVETWEQLLIQNPYCNSSQNSKTEYPTSEDEIDAKNKNDFPARKI